MPIHEQLLQRIPQQTQEDKASAELWAHESYKGGISTGRKVCRTIDAVRIHRRHWLKWLKNDNNPGRVGSSGK
jgi:hypothetical protein